MKKQAKRVKWVCPECEGAKLGSKRPRVNAAIRYCLGCTEKTGFLVERTAPVLEAARLRSAERSRAKSAAKKAREAAPYTVEGVDLRRELVRLCGPKGIGAKRLPGLTIHRTNKTYTTGRAWSSHRLHLSLPKNATLEEAVVVLIHEVAHLALFWGRRIEGVDDYSADRGGAHGKPFLQTMKALAFGVYGVDPSLDLSAGYHKFHTNLEAALRESAWYRRA